MLKIQFSVIIKQKNNIIQRIYMHTYVYCPYSNDDGLDHPAMDLSLV